MSQLSNISERVISLPEKSINNRPLLILWGVGIVFSLVLAAGAYLNFWYLLAIPPALLGLYLGLFRQNILYLLLGFFTPLSVQLAEFYPELPIDIYLPTEPLLLLLLFISLLSMLLNKRLDSKFISHPLSLVILAYLGWIFFTTLLSTHPIVSIKYLLVRLWYIVPFFFFFPRRGDAQFVMRFFYMFMAGLLVATIYTVLRHSTYGFFDKQAVYFVMSPFYRDHTSYGAALAMILPILLGIIYLQLPKRGLIAFLLILLLGWFSLATVLSYTRAAWISLLGAGILFLLMSLRVHVKYLIVVSSIFLLLVFVYWPQIAMQLEQNKQDSSNELNEHVQSVTNIATDVSNLERINRWKSAFRMVHDRPIVGFGPGTYQFEYAGFQRSYDMTWVSTNFGDIGNAHSEYIGAAAEMGMPGMLLFSLLIVIGLLTGYRVVHKLSGENKVIAIALLLSVSTYYIHAFLNNFLDMDKIAILFWFAHGWLVYMDVEIDER